MGWCSARCAGVVFVSLYLMGCGASSHEEVWEWVASERGKTQPRVPPLPEPKVFQPEAYSIAATTMEPFNSQKLTQALQKEMHGGTDGGGVIAMERARRKEPLEAYPLDVMAMVGCIIKDGQSVALLRVDGLLYQVRMGGYLGQNYGKVTKVTESEITLREMEQDAAGEWTERITTMQLQEGTK